MKNCSAAQTLALAIIVAAGAQDAAAQDAAPAGPPIAAPAAAAAPTAPAVPAPSISVNIDNPESLKGMNRVAIGTFTVDILDRQEATTQISGIELVTGAPSDIVVTLVGVDAARYQPLAEAAYRRFAADLTAQGFAVVPAEELSANADFQKMRPADGASDRLEKSPAGTNHYVSAQGLPMYMIDETTLFPKMEFHLMGPKPKRDPYMSWSTAFGAGFSMMNFEKQRALAKSLNAQILNVRVTLLGGQTRIDRSFWMNAGSSRTDAAMTFVPLYNRILVVGPAGKFARISLAQDVATEKLGDLVSTTSGGTKATQTAANTAIAASRVLSKFGGFGGLGGGAGIIGSMHYSNKSTYELRTDQSVFEAALDQGFGRVSQSLTGELAKAR